jgi:hypothetical protein
LQTNHTKGSRSEPSLFSPLTLRPLTASRSSGSRDLHWLGSFIFFGIFIAAVVAQISAKVFHPLYWITIVATTTLGTTMADFADRSLGPSESDARRSDGAVEAVRGGAGRRHRLGFTLPHLIQQAIWLYVRFTLSFRDVEDLLGIRLPWGFV